MPGFACDLSHFVHIPVAQNLMGTFWEGLPPLGFDLHVKGEQLKNAPGVAIWTAKASKTPLPYALLNCPAVVPLSNTPFDEVVPNAW